MVVQHCEHNWHHWIGVNWLKNGEYGKFYITKTLIQKIKQ